MTQQAPGTTAGGPMAGAGVEPVRATVMVEASQERAFEVFTTGMNAWWPRRHKIGATDLEEAILEPHAGGRWYERDADGSECDWGRVLAYELPDRLVFTWQITPQWAFDPDLVTEIEVRFIAVGPTRTRVEVEHRDLERFGSGAEQMRTAFNSPDGGWPYLLGLFAEAAA